MSQNLKSNDNGRLFAILAYIVPLLGGIVGLMMNRHNPHTRNHGQQTIGAILTLFIGFLVWVVVGYIIGLIPYFGPVASVSLFALLIGLFVLLCVTWIVGLLHSIRGEEITFPIANHVTRRIFGDVQKVKVVEVEPI